MGSPTECLSLRWDDFESSFKESFFDLRRNEELFDVTLATDSHSIKAHKVILSSCSPFFRHLIQSVPSHHPHPLLYLKGVDHRHLESLITFMYHGEVRLGRRDLDGFLKVAQELKIKGLSQNNLRKDSKETFLEEEELPDEGLQHIEEEDALENEPNYVSEDPEMSYEDDDNDITLKDSNFIPPPGPSEHPSTSDEYVRQLNNEIAKLISNRDDTGNYRCKKCSYFSPRRDTIKTHIEAIHFITSGFKCNICQRTFKTRQSLKNHKLKYHKPTPMFLTR